MSNNNSNQLLAYPIIKELGYRSQINSKELNEMIRSIEESVLRSLLRGTKLQEDTERFNLAVNASYRGLSSKFSQLSYPIDGATSGVAFCSAFGQVVDNDATTYKNEVGGILTLGWNQDNGKLTKIPVYEGVLSPNIQIYLNDVLQPITDPIYNILDKDHSTFWVKETDSLNTQTLEIVLPNSINKTFNYIEVVPFPIFGMKIEKIEYLDMQSRWIQLFPQDGMSFYDLNGPLFLHVAPREFNNSIKISFKAMTNVNAIGFSSIDVANIDYFNNTSTVYLKFENLKTEMSGNPINEIIPTKINLDFYADGVLNNDYNKFIGEISLVTSTGGFPTKTLGLDKTASQDIKNSPTMQLETPGELYLKVVLNEVNKTSPVIRGARLAYNV